MQLSFKRKEIDISQNLKHKILTQEETPKYSFRKYSFGLASALIGLTAFSGGLKGTIAKADTVSNSAVADQKDIDAKQNNKQATLDISYSDDQKQAANVQAKNGSQASHNENNEGKEPAVTVNKQAAAQQTNSNTVKEEQEGKQVVTKPQNSNNTSTATKQVKNNETSATIANAMVNNGETKSKATPKTDENKNIATLDANKLSAESKNTKGNFLSLLNNFAVVKSASTLKSVDINGLNGAEYKTIENLPDPDGTQKVVPSIVKPVDINLYAIITRTITITDPQGNTTKQTQTVTFHRTGTINIGTGEKYFNPWQNDKDGKDTYTFDSVAVPAVNGYTASGSIPSKVVTPDSQGQEES